MHVVSHIPGVRTHGANYEILLDVIVVRGHPRNKQTRVGARDDIVDVEPDTINTPSKVDITSGLGARMIVVIVLLIICLLVCVLFAGLRIVLQVVLIIFSDGVQQRALLES